MRIRQLSIRNYRGIKTLDWKIDEGLVCLVGGGDVTKSTILKAIGAVLSPKWNLSFNDCDFYNLDITQQIEIEATIGSLSDLVLQQFHDCLRGLDHQGNIVNLPQQNVEQVITMKLTISSSLEPEWFVYQTPPGGTPVERPVSAKDRELFGVSEIGRYIDRELTWGYGSSVSKMTGNRDEVTIAFRTARGAITNANLQELQNVADQLKSQSQAHGVVSAGRYKPDLDLEQLAISSGVLCISDEGVPLRLKGLGTRRLIALAAQRSSVNDAGVLLVDEVENALEPYRLRHLLDQLDEWVNQSPTVPGNTNGQVFMTTHSEITIVQLRTNNIHIVTRDSSGRVEVKKVDSSLQQLIRKTPESLLTRKVIVCEGKTEYGLCLALDDYWRSQGHPCWAFLGVAPTFGNGAEASSMAEKIRSLGYEVCYLGDSDRPINPTSTTLSSLGVKVIQWSQDACIEVRVLRDLPWAAVVEVYNLSVSEKGVAFHEKMREYLNSHRITCTNHDLINIEQAKTQYGEPNIRESIGFAIEDREVFKQIDPGKSFGEIITRHLSAIPTTDLASKIEELKVWTST